MDDPERKKDEAEPKREREIPDDSLKPTARPPRRPLRDKAVRRLP